LLILLKRSEVGDGDFTDEDANNYESILIHTNAIYKIMTH